MNHHIGKRLSALALALLTLLGLLTIYASALEPSTVTVELRPSVTILVDGVEQTFYDVTGKEVHTIYFNGTHYLPVRAIGELMGKNVNWNGASKTITLSSPRTTPPTVGTPDPNAKDAIITVEQRPDFKIIVDGTLRTFTDAQGNTVYPLLSSGTNYLPVRAIGELMGKAVSWDGQTRTITLTGNDPIVTDADTFGPSNGTTPATPGTTSNPGTLIGEEAAKTAALAHAKLTASQVTFVKCKLDREDGRQVYEVEFYATNHAEYDYEIDAYTGAILRVDYDAESDTPPSGTGSSGSYISEESAKSIALASVPGATTANVRKIKLDKDDGRWAYEVEIIYNGREYEFEIDAVTGKILKSESERAE
ncbi:MAG: hypothetical protein HFF84_11310 [Oscillibacter sp.]|nr:hypothetical protein [Oscillibacter sp.]